MCRILECWLNYVHRLALRIKRGQPFNLVTFHFFPTLIYYGFTAESPVETSLSVTCLFYEKEGEITAELTDFTTIVMNAEFDGKVRRWWLGWIEALKVNDFGALCHWYVCFKSFSIIKNHAIFLPTWRERDLQRWWRMITVTYHRLVMH